MVHKRGQSNTTRISMTNASMLLSASIRPSPDQAMTYPASLGMSWLGGGLMSFRTFQIYCRSSPPTATAPPRNQQETSRFSSSITKPTASAVSQVATAPPPAEKVSRGRKSQMSMADAVRMSCGEAGTSSQQRRTHPFSRRMMWILARPKRTHASCCSCVRDSW